MKIVECKSLSIKHASVLKDGLIANNLPPLGPREIKLLAINPNGRFNSLKTSNTL